MSIFVNKFLINCTYISQRNKLFFDNCVYSTNAQLSSLIHCLLLISMGKQMILFKIAPYCILFSLLTEKKSIYSVGDHILFLFEWFLILPRLKCNQNRIFMSFVIYFFIPIYFLTRNRKQFSLSSINATFR